VPDDNTLSKRIEDAGTAFDSKSAGDSDYNAGNFDKALTEYEKVHGINPKDTYIAERINLCNDKIANQPRVIRGKVTNAKGETVKDVKIEAEFYKKDKNGATIEAKWKPVGKTDDQGNYSVTVLGETTKLRFSKNERSLTDVSTAMSGRTDANAVIGGLSGYFNKAKLKAEVQITSEKIDVVLKEVVL